MNRIPLHVRLPPETVTRLDTLRGKRSRRAVIAALIDAAPVDAFTDAPDIPRIGNRKPPPPHKETPPRLTPEETRDALDALRRAGETWRDFAARFNLLPTNVSRMKREGMTESQARRMGLAPTEMSE